jgi:hypothetical protein
MVEAIESFGLSSSYQVKKQITEPIITENIGDLFIINFILWRIVFCYIYNKIYYILPSVMELRSIKSDIQEPSPDIVFPNISDPRIRKWTTQKNVISLSPAALDEVAQGVNVEAHVCGVLFKTVGNLSIPVEEGQG